MNRPSVCPLDCPDTCSLAVQVEGDRITAVRGSHANPLTHGAICTKVARLYPEFVHGDTRLTRPLLRTGPRGSREFAPIAWDEALDRVVAGLQEVVARFGSEAVVPFNYAGPHGMLALDSLSARFFHRLGASRLLRKPLCGGVRAEAYKSLYGPVPGTPMDEVAHAKLIVVWGNNATCSNLHLVRLINAAKRQGARLVVVDPKRVRIAEQAHLHLALKPGTDVVLALSIACELEATGGIDGEFVAAHTTGFEAYMAKARQYPPEVAAELCGLEAEAIRTLAHWYRDAQPAVIVPGVGLERNRNGGSGIRALGALPALANKWGVRGGGLVAGAGEAFPKTPDRLQRPDLLPFATRTLNILDISRHIVADDLDPPIRGLFIYNHNPLVVHPDQNRMRRALAKEEVFIVGCDVTLTDSMAYADVVLPACTHFEHDDLFPAYGQHYLQRAEAVIPPVGESLPNTEIFRRLAARFGFAEPELQASDLELMDDALDLADPRLQGVRPSQLPVDRALPMGVGGAPAVVVRNAPPRTPSGRVELVSEAMDQRFGYPLPRYEPVASDYPLALVSPASELRVSSTFGGLPASGEAPPLEMHPVDARARGLTDGQPVRVWNALGEVSLVLKVTEAVRPGVVYSEKGAWLATSTNGQTISALAPAHKADLAEGACYNDARVEVAAAILANSGSSAVDRRSGQNA
ncbi:MAG: molybdopterin-dependent oxidoreductase [Candidatus Competibacterales bacterium]